MKEKSYTILLVLAFFSLVTCLIADTPPKKMKEYRLSDTDLARLVDVRAVCNGFGVDYLRLGKDALRGKERSIALIIWLTENAGFDAASGSQHEMLLYELANRHRARFFSALAMSSPSVKRATFRHIKWFHEGENGVEDMDLKSFLREFPDFVNILEMKEMEERKDNTEK